MTKNNKNDDYGIVAEALREKGFIPLPRLWIKSNDMQAIHRIAKKYRREVNSIRGEVRRNHNQGLEEMETESQGDPMTDIDAAWEAMERLRSGR